MFLTILYNISLKVEKELPTILQKFEMNKSFQAVVAAFRGPPVVLTHKQKVTRFYKRALKLSYNWAVDRDLWHEEACKIRSRFDANMHLDPTSG